MNRIAAMLLILALLPACALAFDLSPYILPHADEYESLASPVPHSAGLYDQIVFFPAEGRTAAFEYHLRRYENGSCTLDIPLPEHMSYEALLYPDGRTGVLQIADYGYDKELWKHRYTIYDVKGEALVNARTFDGDPYALALYPFGFAGMRDYGEDHSELVIYDSDTLEPRFRYVVPFGWAYVQDACQSGGGAYLLIKQHGLPSLPDCLVLRVTADGLSWVYHTTDKEFRYNCLYADGQGGVLLKGSLAEDYKRSRITHLNAEGKGYWSRTLYAKNAVIHPSFSVENPDGTATLYGYCVAKSRDLYTVFAMLLDPQGDIRSLDVRDYSARADTGPELIPAADGTVLVYSFEISSIDKPGVLVPFDALPAAENPGIGME